MLLQIFAAAIILLDLGLLVLLLSYSLDRFLGTTVLSQRLEGLLDLMRGYYRELGFTLASISVLGSLYISEILEIAPCELCWYQRILIFPIPIILGVSLFLEKQDVADYVLPLASLGIPISAYHYIVQWTQAASGCSTQVSCGSIQVQEFGFVTVPWMSLTFFAATVVLMLMDYQDDKRRQ